MFDLIQLVRENIRKVVPYSSARDEFSGDQGIFLDANENPITSLAAKDYNRYPDPHQRKLKKKISGIKKVSADNIFLGNGSDEPIDLLFRVFCEPKVDEVMILPPTYGMYKVSAGIQDISISSVPLDKNFDIEVDKIKESIKPNTKIIFICTPNNPTGNSISYHKIKEVLHFFKGLVVIDEAYIDFSDQKSFVTELDKHPNLVILHTFSKAWGMAALRLGMCFASEEIIQLLTKIKFPYNINQATIDLATNALDKADEMRELVNTINAERVRLASELDSISCVEKIYPSETNFLLVKVSRAKEIHQMLISEGIIVRDRSSVLGCEGCLRISIGTKEENDQLLKMMKKY